MMKASIYQAGATCHIGKKRVNNEDNLFFDQHILPMDHLGTRGCLRKEGSLSDPPALFAVFDGMGGHLKGELASFITAEETWKNYDSGVSMPEGPEDFLRQICLKANARVCHEMEKARGRIGTTAAMVLLNNDKVTVCNIGDSPIYLFRRRKILEIYEEHSERQLREKLYGRKAVEGKKFPLTQHIGIFPHEMGIDPYAKTFSIRKGDIYLLCSDGLTDMVSQKEIQSVLSQKTPVEYMVMQLLDMALDHGGVDNITIILVRVE